MGYLKARLLDRVENTFNAMLKAQFGVQARRALLEIFQRKKKLTLKKLVHGTTQKLARYQCRNWGFKARRFDWQRPGCIRRETHPPRRTTNST